MAAEAVAWLGAVQAQDFAGACWAVAMRLARGTIADVERAFDDGRILRTHVLRPTWHFIAPVDLRWIQRLTAPRVRMRMAPYNARLGITSSLIAKSRRVFESALKEHGVLTRAALGTTLHEAGIDARNERLAHLVMHAELDAVICSGPRAGKQFTYALADQRAAGAPGPSGDEALAELLRRYLVGHGPATVRDFAWWSGLTMADARRSADILGAALRKEILDGLTYWSIAAGSSTGHRTALRPPHVRLLPNYDEYLIAYQNRALTAAPSVLPTPNTRDDIFAHVVIIDGRVSGVWRRAIAPTTLTVTLKAYRRWTREERKAVERGAARYATALGLALQIDTRR